MEGGCEGDQFNGFKVVNRVVNPEGANGWAIVESSTMRIFGNGVVHG